MFAKVRSTLDSLNLPKNPVLRLLALIFLVPATLIVMPIWEIGKQLSREAYKGWARAIFNGMFGFGLALGSSATTAGYIGWTLDWSVIVWFPAGIIAFLITLFVAWPAAFLYVIKPVFDALERLFKFTNKMAKELAKPLFDTVIEVASLLPGSGSLWRYVEDEKQGSKWVLKVAVFIAGAGIVGIGVFVAIAIHLFALTLLPVAWATLTPALAWSAGGLVGLALAIVAFQLLEHGDLHFAAQAITAAGVYAALPLLGKVVLALAWPQWSLYALSAVGFALGIAYVYPALHALFKSGFMRKIIEGIKWMLEKTYDENDEEYRTFFAHLVTLIGACALAIVALTAASVLPVIPAYAVYAAAAVVFLVAYLGLGDFFDGDAGAVCTGLLASAATGYYFYDAFAGAWQGIVFWPALVGAIVITFTFAVPMAYIALRAVTRPWLSAPAGKLLDGLHDRSYKAARAVSKWWDKEVIKRSYDDTTPYRELFSHVANLTIVGLGIWKACPTLVGWLAAPGLWSMAYLGGFVFLGYVTYLLLGRTLKGIGSSALGFAAGIAATIYTGYNLYQLDPSYWWVAALIGLTAGSIVTWILFPVAYMVVRFPANLILTPWLRPLLVGVFDFLWKGFEGIWNAFVAVYKMVHNAIFAPFIRLLAGVFKAARDIWESVLGRKRS